MQVLADRRQVLAAAICIMGNPRSTRYDAARFAQWEPEIAAFEASDLAQTPPQNAVLFVGSSSIRLWETLATDFPNITTINRGFGGSQLRDSVHFAPRIVWPYQPRQIVLYAGDNDLAEGETPAAIFDDWRDFVNIVRQRLPQTPITYIAIKPSPSREHLMPLGARTNALIRDDIAARDGENLAFIDIWDAMLDESGKPRGELFVEDELHLNREGYNLWTQIVKPHLD